MMERDLPLLVSFDGSDRSTMNLESWTIDTGYLTSTDGFEFELFDEPGLMRDLEMQPVTLTLDGKQQLCGVNEPLWIAKRTLRFSPTEGSTTQLECWRPGSFPFIEEVE